MQKLLISIVVSASILFGGCALPGTFKIDVQQGNVITQDMVNELSPGMTKDQVRYVLGTPLLVDPFHTERWDYFYSFHPGRGERTQQRVTLFFEEDRLARIEGDLRPQAGDERAPRATPEPVVVPPGEGEDKGMMERLKDAVTFCDKEK